MKSILLALGLVMPSILFSQNIKTAQTSVHFASDEFHLQEKDKLKLKRWMKRMSDYQIVSISLKGHTDSDADSIYNLNLSKNRVNEVKDYLKSLKIGNPKFISSYHGESIPIKSNLSAYGKLANRRVSIALAYKTKGAIKTKEIAEEQPKETIEEVKDPKTDTLITFREGSQILIDKKEFLKRKDCLELEEAVGLDQILNSGMGTSTNNGVPLISQGMMRMKTKDGCDTSCFDKPITIRIRVPGMQCNDGFIPRGNVRAYAIDSRGNWKQIPGRGFKTVKVNGILYYELKARCPNFCYNMDYKTNFYHPKFEIPEGLQLLSFKVSSDCPKFVITKREEEKGNSFRMNLPVYNVESFVVEARFATLNGDTLQLQPILLNDLYHRKMFAGYPSRNFSLKNRYWFNGFFTRYKDMYRKYYVFNYDMLETGVTIE